MDLQSPAGADSQQRTVMRVIKRESSSQTSNDGNDCRSHGRSAVPIAYTAYSTSTGSILNHDYYSTFSVDSVRSSAAFVSRAVLIRQCSEAEGCVRCFFAPRASLLAAPPRRCCVLAAASCRAASAARSVRSSRRRRSRAACTPSPPRADPVSAAGFRAQPVCLHASSGSPWLHRTPVAAAHTWGMGGRPNRRPALELDYPARGAREGRKRRLLAERADGIGDRVALGVEHAPALRVLASFVDVMIPPAARMRALPLRRCIEDARLRGTPPRNGRLRTLPAPSLRSRERCSSRCRRIIGDLIAQPCFEPFWSPQRANSAASKNSRAGVASTMESGSPAGAEELPLWSEDDAASVSSLIVSGDGRSTPWPSTLSKGDWTSPVRPSGGLASEVSSARMRTCKAKRWSRLQLVREACASRAAAMIAQKP